VSRWSHREFLGGRANPRAARHRVVVVSPDDTGITAARAKTDKLDARALALLLWRGELDAVWMPDERCQILRRRLQRREQLVHARSRSKNEIHAVLQRRLKGKPPCTDLFGSKAASGSPVWSCRWRNASLLMPASVTSSSLTGDRCRGAADRPAGIVRGLRSGVDDRPGVNVICAASFIGDR